MPRWVIGNVVRVFSLRLQRFIATLRWMMVDALWRFRGSTTWILGGGLAALGLQVAAIGVSAWYAHGLENGITVEGFGASWDARTSGTLLAIVGGAVLLLLLGSAWLAWMSRRHEVRLMSNYQMFCTRRALRVLGGARFVLPVTDDGAFGPNEIRRVVRGDAAFLGRSVRLLVGGIVPAVTCVLAAVTLVALEPLVTAVTFGVVLLSIAFLYRVNLAAARSSHELEAQLPVVGREVRELVNALRDRPAATTDAPELDEPFERGGFASYLGARDGRMFAMERGRFVSNTFLAIGMFTVIVMLGVQLINDGTGWGRMLVYIVALRHGLVNFRSFTTMLTSINRFHKQIARYRALLHAAEATTIDAAADTAAPDEPMTVRCRTSAFAESATERVIAPGDTALIVTPLGAARYLTGAVLAALLPKTSAAWLPHVVAATAPNQAWDTEDPLGVGTTVTEADVRALAADTALESAALALVADPAAAWASAPRAVRTVYAIAAAIRQMPAVVVIGAAEYGKLPEVVQARVRAACAGAILLLLGGDQPIPAELDVDHVVVCRPSRVIGLGDVAWWSAQRGEIEPALGVRVAASADDADELDEEELLG